MKKLLIVLMMTVFLTGCFKTSNDNNSETDTNIDNGTVEIVGEIANEIFDIIDREDKDALRDIAYIGNHGGDIEIALENILSLKDYLVGDKINQQIYLPTVTGDENSIINFNGFGEAIDTTSITGYNCVVATDGLESASVFYEMESGPHTKLIVVNLLKENEAWKLSKIFITNYKILGGDINHWLTKGKAFMAEENYMMAYFALRHSESLIQLNDNILYEDLDAVVIPFDTVVKLIPEKYIFPIEVELVDMNLNIYNIDLSLYEGDYVYQIGYQSSIPILAENKELFVEEANKLQLALMDQLEDLTPGLAIKILYIAYNEAPIDSSISYDAFYSLIDFPVIE